MAAVGQRWWRVDRAAAPLFGALRGLLLDLERFALPQRCTACGAEIGADSVLCRSCLTSIPRLVLPLCLRCLASGRPPDACRRHAKYQANAAWIYDERAAAVVHALKYQGRPCLAEGLGAVIAASLPAAYRPELIVEVPLHPARRRERGYNQAARLAEAVSRQIGCPRLEGALERTRATRTQARLGPAARRSNLAGAFRVACPGALAGRSILIVDDVITTGSTLEACCDALARSGAQPRGVALAWAD
jgi:ComF family protein